MSHIQRQKKVNYSAEQMYHLVNDVDQYQVFVPYCSQSEVISQKNEEMIASLTFSFAGLQQTLTTHNTLKPPHEINLKLVSGPFKHLHGFWRFEPIDAYTSLITMDLAFDMTLGPMMLLVQPLMQQTIESLVDVFLKRAEEIYG